MNNLKDQSDLSLFEYYPNKKDIIGFLSIPHSGEYLPEDFEPFLSKDTKALMQDVDYKVHELIDIEQIADAGIAVIKSNIIRTAIDLNRDKEKALLNWKNNSKGIKVVISEPSAEEAHRLINLFYTPYFELIKTTLNKLLERTETPNFIDLHSMPSRATEYHLKINPGQSKVRPDFCVSDKSGTTCKKDFIDSVTNAISVKYKSVTQNNPYFGGYITEHVNNLIPSGNNIQIEISREVYMDENSQKLIPTKQAALKPFLTEVIIKTFQEKFKSI